MVQPEKILPITSESWDEGGEYGDIQFYNVTFLEDFGPYKKGQKLTVFSYSRMTANCPIWMTAAI